MKIIKSFEDLYPHDIEHLIGSHELAKQLTYDLFIVHQSFLNEGFDDCAIFYILECEADYLEFKKLQPYIHNSINEYEYEDNGVYYAVKIINDFCLVAIGRKEFFDED